MLNNGCTWFPLFGMTQATEPDRVSEDLCFNLLVVNGKPCFHWVRYYEPNTVTKWRDYCERLTYEETPHCYFGPGHPIPVLTK